jgi:hypothetical protein
MYWLISQFPELDHLEPEQRQLLLARVPWQTYPLLTLGALIQAIFAGAGIAVAWIALGFGWDAAVLPVMAVVVLVIAIVRYQFQLRQIRRELREVVARAYWGRRLPFCFRCGYDLRQSNSIHCPECGFRVDRTDAPASLSVSGWLCRCLGQLIRWIARR